MQGSVAYQRDLRVFLRQRFAERLSGRAAFLSMFICPSAAKGGKISTIVPLVSHLHSSEHSVSIIETEQGVADLRGKSPACRAKLIIEHCAHPDYKPLLLDYVERGGDGHSQQSLGTAFGMPLEYSHSGDMRKTDWAKHRYGRLVAV